ncbi:hypothetical protein [Sphaerisporangium fuscum]|uniref:hypothetical protein n=1 Tax=Sphaerisporangium fuscum TaxID=2835868 RepID=UPI001BDDA480|nr:hypothetical protein [Sphaerisporangium fuscum]
MPVEFLGIGGTNDGTESISRSGPSFDKHHTPRLARAHQEYGRDVPARRVAGASGR